MNSCRWTTLGLLLLLSSLQPAASADLKPATARVEDQTYWVGQRVPLFVELRAKGSFSGAASFSLPNIPRTVILKIGNPVVSSEEVDGDSVFVQTHEFALFSQQSGTVEVPPFEVRFSHQQGFTRPVKDEAVQVAPLSIKIKRPPGDDENTFLVTTPSLKITETWDPQPGPTQPGSIFHRTITQDADEVSGMALAPPPESAADGIRVYVDSPEVRDQTQRGAFQGHRSDKITYAMQSPGTWTLPAIKYVWWDPEKEQFGSQTLPAATFRVTAPPAETAQESNDQSPRWGVWLLLGVVLMLGALVIWQRHRVIRRVRQAWYAWNPPQRAIARKLLRACRRNDPKAAETAWLEWENWQAADFQPTQALRAAVMDLQNCLYGRQRSGVWQGTKLAQGFREQRATASLSSPSRTGKLPQLNPTSISKYKTVCDPHTFHQVTNEPG